ncbi:hypothetical protein Taro_028685 [Colocasia esculenta]|uniref:Uncharacterized protein n=1 Tax=Colocasia esculenta TaxID=4460 RepID=A0A843VJ90_COLES|nr:hypothetical protein [Colocasia esculenta]
MSASMVEPHDKNLRARDVSKVARGEQAPRPPRDTDSPAEDGEATSEGGVVRDGALRAPVPVSAEPDTSLTVMPASSSTTGASEPKGGTRRSATKFAHDYRSLCPSEWVHALPLHMWSFRSFTPTSLSFRVCTAGHSLCAGGEMDRADRDGGLPGSSLNRAASPVRDTS